ncbi:tRNA lysidine(34) synthetase TilS [Kosakonia sacchari]|uniref:tRNA lysidine(34) synthetase TilS n=1 Tax=Kosakonia sacchari TaxID=1158459 RepID=UPI0025B1FC47|nr:tRNA lysidine(34) synthetase TilS [Kosakonia sacchari]MDN2487481.1 tRNA lysidine(34) synthetase TilS [Kosakonia sacchari]
MTTPFFASMPTTSRQFLVAFSGGLDSTVLLHKLMLWRQQLPELKLRAIHIHHGLSPHADAWAEHCEDICARWQIPLSVVRVQVVNNGDGIEAQARNVRYQAFADALMPGEVLVTAQHLDDQCETFLLALKRGSGPAGLAAMPESMLFAGTQLIRPLLTQTRDELHQWALHHALSWIEDESNADASFDRNFLRLQVLPVLAARWPHFADAVARSAALCGEQEQLLDELLAEELDAATTAEGALQLAPLYRLSDARRRALLRRWLAQRGAVMPSRAMLDRLWLEVALAREDASPCLRLGEFEIRRYQSCLWWIRAIESQRDTQLPWVAPFEPLTLPAGLGELSLLAGGEIRTPNADEAVSIRFQAPGMLHIVGRSGGRKLKKIWQELGVAPWRRDTTPLLFYGETLMAAAGLFVTQEGAKRAEETGIRLEWRR